MKKLATICAFLLTICVMGVSFGDGKDQFSLLNNVQFGDTVQEVLDKEPNASEVADNGELDLFDSSIKKDFVKEFLPIGNEEAEVYYIFNTEGRLVHIIYRLSNQGFLHAFNLASTGSDPDYKGADNEEQFKALYEQIKGSITKKYGEPLLLGQGETFPLSTGAKKRMLPGQSVLESSEWICAYDGYSIKIDLLNAGGKGKNPSYKGAVIVGYTLFDEETVNQAIKDNEDAQEALDSVF